jgi:hypothetical protein
MSLACTRTDSGRPCSGTTERVARSPFKRTNDGAFAVRLNKQERDALGALPDSMRQMITGETAADDPAMARLFPPAYLEDPLRNLDFERVAGDDLLSDRLADIDTMARTVGAERLSEEELLAWMRTVNGARLTLGVRLDVTEETRERDFSEEPEAASYAMYVYLSWLLENIVDALGEPGGPEDPDV